MSSIQWALVGGQSPKGRRVGRPVMQNTTIEKSNDNELRKERVRLAQRSHRNRKKIAYDDQKLKAERSEAALKMVVASFMRFHELAIGDQGLSPVLLRALSKTALEISRYSTASCLSRDDAEECTIIHEQSKTIETFREDDTAAVQAFASSSQALGSCQHDPVEGLSSQKPHHLPILTQPTTVTFPWTRAHPYLSFAQTLRLACVERSLQVLNSPHISFDLIHPTLSLHLRYITVQRLRDLTEASLHSTPLTSARSPIPQSMEQGLSFPTAYRTIEDSGFLVERNRLEDVNTMVLGRTRTRVETALPGFEGEWLECVDVEEYLEVNGVVGISNAVPQVSIGSVCSGREVDLHQMIETLAMRAISIGVCAGWRRADIDTAIHSTVVVNQ